jgi:hypothetical protein
MKKPSKPQAVETISEPFRDLATLPAPVRALRDRILAACDTGDIEALRIPIDWNEVRPLFERGARRPAGADPIETLKALSFDRAGRETLSLARAVLTQPFVRVARGPFQSYEWPAYARRPTPPANEEEARALWACVRFSDLAASNAQGRPKVMRIGVGADGVWHYFWNAD